MKWTEVGGRLHSIRRPSITKKIVLILVGTNLATLLLTGLVYYGRHKNNIVDNIEQHLRSAAQQESQLLFQVLDKYQAQHDFLVSNIAARLATNDSRVDVEKRMLAEIQKIVEHQKLNSNAIADIDVTDKSGAAIISTRVPMLATANERNIANATATNSNDQTAMRNDFAVGITTHNPIAVYHDPQHGTLLRFASSTLGDDDKPIVIVSSFYLAEIAAIVQRHIGIGRSEEILILHRDATGRLLPLLPFSRGLDSELNSGFNPIVGVSPNFLQQFTDDRGNAVYAVSVTEPRTGWLIVVKINAQEALREVAKERNFLLASLLLGFSVMLAAAVWFSRTLTRPLNDLIEAAKSIAGGDKSKRVFSEKTDEIGLLANAFTHMADQLIAANDYLDLRVQEKTRELARANQELQRSNAALEKISLQDSLTKVANRRAFDRGLRYEWKRSARVGDALGLIMIDVDCFKKYNDALGHPAGDKCLTQIATVLRRLCRRDNDLIARYGGEEFVILLPGTGEETCRDIANKIVESVVAQRLPHPASTVADVVTVSVGYGSFYPANISVSGIENSVKRVDFALYEAKRLGRNCAISANIKEIRVEKNSFQASS